MPDLAAGDLDRRILIERFTATDDGYGGQIQTWSQLCKAWAKVTFGTGAERRVAAQESATVGATFRVRANSITDTVTPLDRITFDGGHWDISSNVPYGRAGRDITATRAA